MPSNGNSRSLNEVAADIIAAAPHVESLVEEFFQVLVDRDRDARITLSDNDRSALRWTVPILRGIEEGWTQSGIREGEATSDVIAAIVARADRAKETDRV